MFSFNAYILIGENNTGKTSFQKNLIHYLCNKEYLKLPRNCVHEITHPHSPKHLKTLFTSNRSFQEMRGEFKSINDYFKNGFQEASVCILSSHSHGEAINDIEQMITQLKIRCYNVKAVFWSNSFNGSNEKIALLPWSEVLWIENPLLKKEDEIIKQINNISKNFSDYLIKK